MKKADTPRVNGRKQLLFKINDFSFLVRTHISSFINFTFAMKNNNNNNSTHGFRYTSRFET